MLDADEFRRRETRIALWRRRRRYVRLLARRQASFIKLRRRALFFIGGLAIGLIAILMAILGDVAQKCFEDLRQVAPLSPLVVTPLGFSAIAAVTRRYAAQTKGSGIPQVIAAAFLIDGREKQALVSIKGAIFKITLLTLALAVGASAGREGPTVQVGAAIMFVLAPFAAHRQQGLLLAGAGAGIAAAFNAPLAGIMFCIEELSRSFDSKTSGLVVAAVFVAGLTSVAAMGNYSYFGHTGATVPMDRTWVFILLAGGACGLAGGLFSRSLVVFSRGLTGRVGNAISQHPILFAAACGFGIALCGIETAGSTFGTGYAQAQDILTGRATVPFDFGLMKFVTTVLTSISGIPGGFFSPSLAVGAGIANLIGRILPCGPIAPLTIVCMASYLAGVTQAPLTSLIIVSEMTDNHQMVLPLILNVFFATFVSRLVCKTSVYHSLAAQYIRPRG